MKSVCILFVALSLTTLAFGQSSFIPLTNDPVNFSQVNQSEAYVSGHWMPVDPKDKHSEMVGPSISTIYCDHKTCHETAANIAVMGNSFGMNADGIDYAVERWTASEIVASNKGGICRMRNVLKFDRINKRVYWMQTLSEPVNDLPKTSQDICNLAGMFLELRGDTLWRIR